MKSEEEKPQADLPTAKFHLLDQDFGFIKADDRIILIGAAGTGKSATMHYIAEGLHAQGVKVNMLAPLKILELQKSKGVPPTWMTLINYRYPKLEPGTMTLYDDAQLRSHAREWYSRKHIDFNKILSMARHKKAGIIITTQQTNEIDAGVLPKMNYFLIKKPNRYAAKSDRPGIRDTEIAVADAYRDQIIGPKISTLPAAQDYTYVINMVDDEEGFVGPTGLASYWSKELGDW